VHQPWATTTTAQTLMAADPRVSKRTSEMARFQNTSSGLPIKIMTLALMGLTGWFAYDLYCKKRFPHQNGVRLSDAFQR